jgi:hypothetical protein
MAPELELPEPAVLSVLDPVEEPEPVAGAMVELDPELAAGGVVELPFEELVPAASAMEDAPANSAAAISAVLSIRCSRI